MSSLASAGARLCALALLASALVSAALRPSFFLEHCVWHATDIVVVRPVDTLNRFQVVETIKGGLASGDVLNVPGLASTKGAGRTLEELAYGDRTGPLDFEHVFVDPPPVQTDDRLILFFRKTSAPDGSIEWRPASPWNHLLTSALWLQRGSVYAYEVFPGIGNTHLDRYFQTEEQVRSAMARVLGLRASLDDATANPDPVERSRRLLALLHSGDDLAGAIARGDALTQLAAGGPAETAALIQLLGDESLVAQHSNILAALAGKPIPDDRLAALLRDEASYWASACGTLKPDWAHEARGEDNQARWSHYDRARALFKAARQRDLPFANTEAARFRNAWNTCPAMNRSANDDPFDE